MTVRQMVISGTLRGWSNGEAYARDFFQRKYYWKTADKVAIETKREMKAGRKGIPGTGKSPDHGDSLSYLVDVAVVNGLRATTLNLETRKTRNLREEKRMQGAGEWADGITISTNFLP